jgi:tetratricopeptide (TPR) repeat protein
LLPGSADCLVLITSRDELTSLVAVEGAHPLAVDLPSQDEARELVARRLGADRTAAEPYAVEELIARCARLPLAMVIVAARAVTRPQLPLGLLVDELRESAGGLDAFDGGDSATDVRAVFSWSYRTLGAEAARLFRLLGRHCGQDIALPAVASLAGVTPARARLVLAELTRAHLVSEQAHGRYTFHDLLRAYAAELAEANDGDEEHHAAAHRLFDHYLHAAHDAAQLLEPHRETIAIEPAVPGVAPVSLTTFGQAHAWLETEHRVLVHTIDRAAEQGFGTHTWQLACTLLTYFQRRGHWHDQAATLQVALSATRRAADPLGQAYSLLGLARAYFRLGRQDDAHAILIESLDLFAHCGHDLGRARAYGSLAFVYTSQGRYREALEHLQTSLDLFQADGRPQGEGQLLNDLGWNHALLGNYQQALIHCHRALMLLRQVNDLHGQASTWDSLGYVYAQLGRYERAIACYRQALRLFREVGERYLEADTLTHLGDNHQARGDLDTSRVIWREALAILDELGHPAAEEVRVRLRHLDQPAPALSLA